MSLHISEHGVDGQSVNIDSLGVAYITIAIVWTILVTAGAVFLLAHRHLPALRVRNTHLWTSAVLFLHAYWVLCLLAYVMNGSYPCSAEFWIMNLWFPFGIALYQINGMHLLHISSIQSRFVHPHALNAYCGSKAPAASRRCWNWPLPRLPKSLSPMQKSALWGGMVSQMIVSIVLYCFSRRFHPSWGVFGSAVGPEECRRGVEWIPSIAWQVFWSWGYAPYLLWRVRKIQDLHGWRLQTIICSIAGLPGSPLWLLALYSPNFSPAFARFSEYFGPPLWFTPGIFAMEISVILIPCLIVIKSQKLKRETRQHLIAWEKQDKDGSVDSDSTLVPPTVPTRRKSKHAASSTSSMTSRKSELYSMKALEKALSTNITPLLQFSALRDFSGENISFLKHIQDWRAVWKACEQPNRSSLAKKMKPTMDVEAIRRHQFAVALEIYIIFIDPSLSEFPVNISGPQIKDLQLIFEEAASQLGIEPDSNNVTPFDMAQFPTPPADDVEHHAAAAPAMVSSVSTLSRTSSMTQKHESFEKDYFSVGHVSASALQLPSLLELTPRLHDPCNVPLSFGPHIFDDSERAVKYAVLTNTWPKFVGEGLSSRTSLSDSGCKTASTIVELNGWERDNVCRSSTDASAAKGKLWGKLRNWRPRRK